MDNEQAQEVLVREAKMLVWGPIYVTLNLEKTPNNPPPAEETPTSVPDEEKAQIIEKKETVIIAENNKKTSVNILSPAPNPAPAPPIKQPDNSKKVTYVYNLIDHGLDCECIDVKGELLIRSALPVYRKITQGIEFEQITSNQIKLIITSRVLDSYQEVFQGFAIPKATFRIWILGYKFL